MSNLKSRKNTIKPPKTMTKEDFLAELQEVKKSLPYHYGIILSHKFPELDMRRVYNVVNYQIHDEVVLEKLKYIITSKN